MNEKIEPAFKALLLSLVREALVGLRASNEAVIFQRLSRLEDELVNA